MVNPIEVIARTRMRLARLAAVEAAVVGSLPILATIALGLSVKQIGAAAWTRWGYVIPQEQAHHLRSVMFAAAGLEMLATAIVAFYAWRKAADFAAAAEKIDELVGAHQELLTLADLANPSQPQPNDHRSALFAVLWRHAIAYLNEFDPRRSFGLALATPLSRSLVAGFITAVIIASTIFLLMRRPSATQAAAYALYDFANSVDVPGATSGAREIAEAARDVAKDLANPRLPPPQQLAELVAIRHEIQNLQNNQSGTQQGSGNASGKSNGNGDGSGNGSGSGSGSGNGGEQGKGAGNGSSTSGKGTGSGSGGKNEKTGSQSMQLQKSLDQAEAKLEESSGAQNKSQTGENRDQNGTGTLPQAGSSPTGGGGENAQGTGSVKMPEPGKLAQSHAPGASGDSSGLKNDHGSQGDTHLGDFPKPVNYQHYYKLGEQGPPIDIKNARYVTFRLPAATVSKSGEGKLVRDTGAPVASAPYTNAPLKQESSPASPDEEQLLPPRYRELIR